MLSTSFLSLVQNVKLSQRIYFCCKFLVLKCDPESVQSHSDRPLLTDFQLKMFLLTLMRMMQRGFVSATGEIKNFLCLVRVTKRYKDVDLLQGWKRKDNITLHIKVYSFSWTLTGWFLCWSCVFMWLCLLRQWLQCRWPRELWEAENDRQGDQTRGAHDLCKHGPCPHVQTEVGYRCKSSHYLSLFLISWSSLTI